MKKIIFGLLILMFPTILNAQTESCYCQKFGVVVPSSQQCAGQCYPAERIRKQDKDCTCFVWITKIDDKSYYTGQHDCSCHAFNRPIEGSKDTILKSLQEEYPDLPNEYNIDPSFMRVMFGAPEDNH